jgi:hypothetical protein
MRYSHFCAMISTPLLSCTVLPVYHNAYTGVEAHLRAGHSDESVTTVYPQSRGNASPHQALYVRILIRGSKHALGRDLAHWAMERNTLRVL